MNITSLGDLAMSAQMRRETGSIKLELERASAEISSGYSSDILGQLRGDFSRLSGIESDLARMDGYRANIREFGLVLEAQQGVIHKIRELGSVSATFLSFPGTVSGPMIDSFGGEGLSAFTAALQALNGQVGGRAIFSGTATDSAAVADADTILTAIEAEIVTAGATTASDIEVVVDTWFNPGGGFDTVGYLGGPVSSTSVQLSDSERGGPFANAEEDALRDTYASLAMAALVGRGALSGDIEEQAAMIRRSGEKLLHSDDKLIELQASIGQDEGALARASAEVSSQKDSLQMAKAELIEVDPYDAATRLQNAEIRLQSIYTITGRLSRLSLAEYL